VYHILMFTGLALAVLMVYGSSDSGAATRPNGTTTAHGTFEVKVTPQPKDERAAEPFGRLFLEKQFHGDLEAVSQGQMLAANTAVEGSGAYVALELVSGTLRGKRGSFMLQHKGTMRRGRYEMLVTVVPDSGTDGLSGIAGTMTILIDGSKHSYQFEYTLGTD
jgi:Protein of unknown function (DUF3224)